MSQLISRVKMSELAMAVLLAFAFAGSIPSGWSGEATSELPKVETEAPTSDDQSEIRSRGGFRDPIGPYSTTEAEQSTIGPDQNPSDVQERGLQRGFVTAPPYSCGSGVCLCVGQDNCNQMTQPQPCKHEKFCLGQTASPPPPLPPQEPVLSQQQTQSMARTTTGSFLFCSCRSGQ